MNTRIKKLSERLKRTVIFLEQDIWKMPSERTPPANSFLLKQLRIFMLAFRGFMEDEIVMRASALTYFTLLSIVPIAGLAFGIAKAFGMESYMELQLEMALMGREEVYEWIMGFSQKILQSASGGMVAGIGMVVLLYTIMRLLLIMEESFNEIWQISNARPWVRKFSDYFSIMFLTPLFFIMSSAITVFLSGYITNFLETYVIIGFISNTLVFLINLIPYLLVWVMLTLMYMIMPFTNVKLSSALKAGIIAGTMFQLVQWSYVYFQIGVSQYNAIYGSFAALPLLLMWIQISWLVILFGGELSYAYQNVDNFEYDSESKNINPFARKMLSLYIMQLLIDNFTKGDKAFNTSEIANRLVMPFKLVQSALNDLMEAELVNEIRHSHSKEEGYQPAMDVNKITIQLVIHRLEHLGNDIQIIEETSRLKTINESLAAFTKTIEESERNVLLKDIK